MKSAKAGSARRLFRAAARQNRRTAPVAFKLLARISTAEVRSRLPAASDTDKTKGGGFSPACLLSRENNIRIYKNLLRGRHGCRYLHGIASLRSQLRFSIYFSIKYEKNPELANPRKRVKQSRDRSAQVPIPARDRRGLRPRGFAFYFS